MFIVLSHYSNSQDLISNQVKVESGIFTKKENAIAKAKQLFEESRDTDLTDDEVTEVSTGDVDEFGNPVVFGIGEYKEAEYNEYHLVYGVVEIPMVPEDNLKPNTRIDYLYRDEDNYKQANSEVIPGHFTRKQINEIIDSLDGGSYFVPSAVGFEEIRFDQISNSDTAWFELVNYTNAFVETDEPVTVDMTPKRSLRHSRSARGTGMTSHLIESWSSTTSNSELGGRRGGLKQFGSPLQFVS